MGKIGITTVDGHEICGGDKIHHFPKKFTLESEYKISTSAVCKNQTRPFSTFNPGPCIKCNNGSLLLMFNLSNLYYDKSVCVGDFIKVLEQHSKELELQKNKIEQIILDLTSQKDNEIASHFDDVVAEEEKLEDEDDDWDDYDDDDEYWDDEDD